MGHRHEAALNCFNYRRISCSVMPSFNIPPRWNSHSTKVELRSHLGGMPVLLWWDIMGIPADYGFLLHEYQSRTDSFQETGYCGMEQDCYGKGGRGDFGESVTLYASV